MENLHMKRQGSQLNKEKTPDTEPEDNIKKNVGFCTTVDPITKKRRENLLRSLWTVPHHVK